MGHSKTHWGLLAAFSFALCTLLPVLNSSSADEITVQSGRRYEGEVVGEDGNSVTLRVEVPGSSLAFNQKIDKAHIQSWVRPARQGAAYVQIPVIGEIGTDVTVQSIGQALAAARAERPEYVVLQIDSNGGQIDAMNGICDQLMGASKEFKIVANVKKAYSAAAIIAMACKDIYIAPSGVIGAAVPMKITRDGPKDIQAKMVSAIEAKERTYVAAAGHDDLLLRGMIEMDLEIYLKQRDGKTVLDTAGPGTKMKSSGQILTLTAAEAAACGLAHQANDLADVGKQLTGGAWYECSRQPWDVAKSAAAPVEEAKKERVEKFQRAVVHMAAASAVQSQIASMQQQALQLTAKIDSDRQQIGDLVAKCKSDCDQIEADFHDAAAKAAHDPNGAYEIAVAKENARKKIADAHTACDAATAPLQADADGATTQVNQLRKRAADLIASISLSQ